MADDATSERERVAALLSGDASAFISLVDEHNDTMLRVARAIVASRSVAEEVVQETWLAILEGLARFEGRSSLKTWMFRILTNRARTRVRREGRTTPQDPVDLDRVESAGRWPDELIVDHELGEQVEAAIEALPERQRMVITLRDVKGWTSDEVRNVMDLSETNQRVLLHRARSRVRQALDDYLKGNR